jgi:oligosaccharide repeat unit polymerase
MISNLLNKHLVLMFFIIQFVFYYFIPAFNHLILDYHFNTYFKIEQNSLISILITFCFISVCISYILFGLILPIKEVKEKDSDSSISINILITFVFIAFLAAMSFAKQYGGIGKVIYMGSMIRSGVTEHQALGFVRYFSNMVLVLMPVAVLCLIYEKKNRIKYLFITTVCIITWLIISLGSGGREVMITPLFFLGIYLISKKSLSLRTFTLLLTSFVFVLFIIVYGKSIFMSLSIDREISVINSTFYERYFKFFDSFAYPYYSLNYAINHSFECCQFYEFYQAPINMIPNMIIEKGDIYSITNLNTLYSLGNEERTVPPGALAYYIYSGGYTGLLIGCISFGWVMHIPNLIRRTVFFKQNSIFHSVLMIGLSFQIAKLFFVGDPLVSIYHLFGVCFLILCWIILFLLRKGHVYE